VLAPCLVTLGLTVGCGEPAECKLKLDDQAMLASPVKLGEELEPASLTERFSGTWQRDEEEEKSAPAPVTVYRRGADLVWFFEGKVVAVEIEKLSNLCTAAEENMSVGKWTERFQRNAFMRIDEGRGTKTTLSNAFQIVILDGDTTDENQVFIGSRQLLLKARGQAEAE